MCLVSNPGFPIFVPTVVAQDMTVARGAAVTLDAGASGGPWGTNVTYAWTQTGGTDVTLTGADTATPSFSAPATSGTLTFSVTVTGAGGPADCLAHTDTTTVTVTVERPCKDSYLGAVRLAGENRAMPDREGRLEICYDDGDEDMSDGDGWGVICDDYWTDNRNLSTTLRHRRFLFTSFRTAGGLIQTASGSGAGFGVPWTKRSG